MGSSLWWLLQLQSTSSKAHKLSCLQHVESSQTKDQTCDPCIGRQILNHWTTRQVQPVVFEVTTGIVWEHHKSYPYKTLNNQQMFVVFWLLHYLAVPVYLPLLRPPYSLRHNIEMRPVNNPTKASSERKSHMTGTLNQKLEMTKLSEKGM